MILPTSTHAPVESPPRLNSADLSNRGILQKNGMRPSRLGHKRHCGLCLAPFWITHSLWKNPAAMMGGDASSDMEKSLRLLPTALHFQAHEWATLKVDPPAPVMLLDESSCEQHLDYNLMIPWFSITQLRSHWGLDTQKLCERVLTVLRH